MLPTYSLLTSHEDVVTYRVPHPDRPNEAYVEIGLYSWELSGASAAEAFQAALDGRRARDESHEGVGFRIKQHPPTHYPTVRVVEDIFESQFDVFSQGGSKEGQTYRLNNATAGELREVAREVAQFAFCYWWALEQSDEFEPGVERKESYYERKKRLDIVESVSPDGTVVLRDGTSLTAPYSRTACDLIPAEDWQTPKERCLDDLNWFVEELRGRYPDAVVRNAYRALDIDHLRPIMTPTEELKKHEQFEKQLLACTRDASGIGRRTRNAVLKEFESMTDLCDDIRRGGDRLKEIRGVGYKTEQTLMNAIVAAGEWVPEQAE
jgi:hypothetical protein